jgi:hypothetical protein
VGQVLYHPRTFLFPWEYCTLLVETARWPMRRRVVFSSRGSLVFPRPRRDRSTLETPAPSDGRSASCGDWRWRLILVGRAQHSAAKEAIPQGIVALVRLLAREAAAEAFVAIGQGKPKDLTQAGSVTSAESTEANHDEDAHA